MNDRCDTHNCELSAGESCPQCVAEIKSTEKAKAPRLGYYADDSCAPQPGDVVEWISNGERWTVCEDDLDGPAALKHWPDGGWCGVRLVHRPNISHHAPAVAGSVHGVVRKGES